MPGDGFTVGIDIGSSALKAVAVDGDGSVVARVRRRYRLEVPTPDRMEHQAGPAWRQAPRQVLDRIANEVGGVRAVCVAGLAPSLAAVDERGVPCSPGLLYGDTRGAVAAPPSDPETDAPPATGPAGPAEDLLRFCASVAPGAAGYWPAQAIANYVIGGAGVVDISTALAMAPLYDGRQWSPAHVLPAGADPSQLPTVSPIGAAIGSWRGAVVASGIVDTLAEQLVAGAVDDGDVLVICGTTLVVWTVTSGWRDVAGLWTVPHTVPGKVLVGGASNAGGLFVDWARSLTGSAPRNGVPDHVPVWAPYPRGERTPLHDRRRRAMLVDLQLGDDRAALRRAAVEATGFVVRRHIDLAGVEAKRVVATGGGTRDAEWMQGLADATRLPVDVVGVPEGAALGAAFVARMAAGLESELEAARRWASVARRIEPEPRSSAAVEARYGLFLEVSATTSDVRRIISP